MKRSRKIYIFIKKKNKTEQAGLLKMILSGNNYFGIVLDML